MITRTYKEKGTSWGSDYTQPYTCVYTQPIHNHIIAWTYHYIWEKLTWRIYHLIEKRWPVKDRYEDKQWLIGIPFSARQDIKCYELYQKNKVVIEMVYGKKMPRSREG